MEQPLTQPTFISQFSGKKRRMVTTRSNRNHRQDEQRTAHLLLNLSKKSCQSSSSSSIDYHNHILKRNYSTIKKLQDEDVTATECATISDDEEDDDRSIAPPPKRRCRVMHFIAGVQCAPSSSITSSQDERIVSILPLPPPGTPMQAAPKFPNLSPNAFREIQPLKMTIQKSNNYSRRIHVEQTNRNVSTSLIPVMYS